LVWFVCRRLLQTLPDKGQKIRDFAEKVRLAVEQHSEEERRQSLVSAAKAEFQSKYQQAFASQQCAVSTAPAPSRQDRNGEDAAGGAVQERETSAVSANLLGNTSLGNKQDQLVSSATSVETMETAAAGAFLNSDDTEEGGLVEALDRVTLSQTRTGESKHQLNNRPIDKYFLRPQPLKKPHYISVLEKTETSSAPRKQKFKPNQ